MTQKTKVAEILQDPRIWETLVANKAKDDWTVQEFSFLYTVGFGTKMRMTKTSDFAGKVESLNALYREPIKILLVVPGGTKMLKIIREPIAAAKVGQGSYDVMHDAVLRFIRLAQAAPGDMRRRMFEIRFWDQGEYQPTMRLTATNPRAFGINPRAKGTNPCAAMNTFATPERLTVNS